jgi:hypothetical protein
VVISSPYSSKERIKKEYLNPIEGDGAIILHGASIDVDVSVRISDLIKRITNLESKVVSLENKLGVYAGEDEEPESVDEIILGIWKLDLDGNDLVISVDYNLGLSVRAWVEKHRWTINEDFP